MYEKEKKEICNAINQALSSHTEPQKTIYQYRGASALKNILENDCFWFTDLNYLNDYKEFKDGLECFWKQVSPHDSLIEVNENDKSVINRLSRLQRYKSSYGYYVCCFTKEGDLLSQWRANYGDYSIGFNFEFFTKSCSNNKLIRLFDSKRGLDQSLNLNEFIFGNIIYNQEEKVEIFKKIITILKKINLSEDEPENNHNIEDIDKFIKLFSVFCKDRGFSEEKEYRLICIDGFSKNIKIRISQDKLIPYTEIIPIKNNNGSDKKLPITEIILSPRLSTPSEFKKSVQSLRILLENCGHDPTKVDIKPSEIPYIGN